MGKLFQRKSSISGLTQDLANLYAAIATEETRANGEETRIEVKFDAAVSTLTASSVTETSRAQGEEARIEVKFDAAVSTLTADLATEVTRASDAEAAEELRASSEEARIEAKFDSAVSTINSTISVIDGDDTVDGSFRKLVKDSINGLINGADGAFDTLKEIEDYIKVSPNTDVLTAILNTVDSAKTELKGTVSTAMDTMGEIEAAVNGEITRASSEESRIEAKFDAAIHSLSMGSSDALANEITRAQGVEAQLSADKMDKASNLSDVANVATARSNLSVYSKEEVDSAISGQSTKTMNVTATVTGGEVTFSKAPIGGLDGVAFGLVRVFGVDSQNPATFDEVQVVLQTSDSSGKKFRVLSDVAGEYDGLTAQAFISYNPAA